MTPELGSLNEDDAAFRPWQSRMGRYHPRRDTSDYDSRPFRPAHRRLGNKPPLFRMYDRM